MTEQGSPGTKDELDEYLEDQVTFPADRAAYGADEQRKVGLPSETGGTARLSGLVRVLEAAERVVLRARVTGLVADAAFREVVRELMNTEYEDDLPGARQEA